MQSQAATVDEYIATLPEERRSVVATLRQLLKRGIPKGYRESMEWGAITWSIPLELLPDTYNGKPLCYVGLAAQKRYFSLYLMGAYADPAERRRLEQGFRRAGKTLDMGKSCLRFVSLDDLPLDVIRDAVGRMTPEQYAALYARGRGKTAAAGKSRAKKVRAK